MLLSYLRLTYWRSKRQHNMVILGYYLAVANMGEDRNLTFGYFTGNRNELNICTKMIGTDRIITVKIVRYKVIETR